MELLGTANINIANFFFFRDGLHVTVGEEAANVAF